MTRRAYIVCCELLYASSMYCASVQAQAQAGGIADAGMSERGEPHPTTQDDNGRKDLGQAKEASARDAHIKALRERATNLRAWMAGELHPSIDDSQLLVFDLVADAKDLGDLVELLAFRPEEERAPLRRARLTVAAQQARQAASDGDALQSARGEFRLALVEFLRLPVKARAALAEDQAKRKQLYQQLLALKDALRERLGQLSQRFEHAQAYMQGTLDPQAELAGLYLVDLAQPVDGGLAATSLDALQETRLKASQTPKWEAALVADCHKLQLQIGDLLEGLATLASRYAALPPEGRQALRATQDARKAAWLAQKQAEAQQQKLEEEQRSAAELAMSAAKRAQVAANAEREAVLKAAEEARTEAQRLLAAEKARVLERKVELSELRARLAVESSELSRRYDEALGLVRLARELHGRSVLDTTKVRDADKLYKQLRAALREYRSDFSKALNNKLVGRTSLPEKLVPSDASVFTELSDRDLERMWAGLEKLREQVESEDRALAAETVDKLHDIVVMLNEARLEVLQDASAALQVRVRGFSAEGIDQVRAEIEHLTLLLRFHIVSLPQLLVSLRDQAMESSFMIMLAAVQILLLFVVYQLYRKHADALLVRLFRQALSSPAPSASSRALARLLWYARRVHRPLGAWAFTAALFHFLLAIERLPEIDFLWIVLQWFFAGWTLVMLVDAFAARQNTWMRQRNEDPKLRIRSLRIVALFLLGTGLLLSLTERSVGKGAIYAWTEFAALLFVVPVSLRLAHLWRGQIATTMSLRKNQTSFVRWVHTNIQRRFGVVAALAGGGYLLSEGVWQWLVRWLADFELFQRIASYLFRRKVHERGDAASGETYASVSDSYPMFAPDVTVPDSALVSEIHEAQLEAASAALSESGGLTLMVGDRGIGKSTVLLRLSHQLGDHALLLSSPGSLVDFRSQLALACDLDPAADDKSLIECLASRHISALLLDDIQSLMRPTVFGLREFDDVLEFVRALRSVVAVVMTCSTAGYTIIRRGRDVLGVDHVLHLESLSRKQIAAIVRARCLAFAVKPNYDALVVPRTFDLESYSSEDPLEAGYFRLLWDYSAGNPAIALLFFQRSLFRDDRDRLVVKIFKEPAGVELDRLPPTMPFVLRTLMQLDKGDTETVARCVDMSVGDTNDAIELGIRRGYLERTEGGVRIAMPWLQEVKVVLRRQHLLS